MAFACACRKFSLPRLFIHQKCLSKLHTVATPHVSLLLKTRHPLLVKPPIRHYFWIFKRRTNREVKLADDPPESYELVYRSSVDNLFLSFQHIGFYTLVLICIGLLVESSSDKEFQPKKEDMEPERTQRGEIAFTKDNQLHLFLCAFLTIFVSIHWFISKAPVRIYYSPVHEKYLMYLYGSLPTRVRTASVKPGDLCEKPGSAFNLWRHEMYEHKITKDNFLLLDEYFKQPADLYVMLGQQQKYPEGSEELPGKPKP